MLWVRGCLFCMACAGAVASEPQQADSAGLPAFHDRHQPSCSAVPLIFHGERPELMETVIHMVTETGLCRLCTKSYVPQGFWREGRLFVVDPTKMKGHKSVWCRNSLQIS